MIQINNTKKDGGFALLITIITLSVVVAVTLSIVELSLMQLKLSVDSKDSEIAFHAANAGLECARYTRRIQSDQFETGANATFNCFDDSASVAKQASLGFITSPASIPVADGQVNRYKRDITWGTAPEERCTSIDIIAIIATTTVTIGGSGVDSLKNKINGYENDTKVCATGERCTIMSVTGYSSACSAISSPSTLRREILLEL